MHEFYWDFESRSAANLTICGAWRYAADPTTQVLCLNYAVDDGEVETWLPPWVTEELGLPEQPIPAPPSLPNRRPGGRSPIMLSSSVRCTNSCWSSATAFHRSRSNANTVR